jgi:hypothetical protein
MRRLILIGAMFAALTVSPAAFGGRRHYVVVGGTSAEQAQARAALNASAFPGASSPPRSRST